MASPMPLPIPASNTTPAPAPIVRLVPAGSAPALLISNSPPVTEVPPE
jgi:hypothetical protein